MAHVVEIFPQVTWTHSFYIVNQRISNHDIDYVEPELFCPRTARFKAYVIDYTQME